MLDEDYIIRHCCGKIQECVGPTDEGTEEDSSFLSYTTIHCVSHHSTAIVNRGRKTHQAWLEGASHGLYIISAFLSVQ